MSLFPKQQLVTFEVTSAVKLTLVPVKIIYVRNKTMIWSAAETAARYGRYIWVFLIATGRRLSI